MKRKMSLAIAATGMFFIAACAPQAPAGDTPAPAPQGGAPAAPTSAAASAGPVSIYTGAYSAEQADRGEAITRRACAACHSTSDWAQGRILNSWTGQSAFDLVTHIRNTMPLNAPGSLSLQEYTDIVAYMLELNDVPAGDAELPAEEAGLRNFELEYRR